MEVRNYTCNGCYWFDHTKSNCLKEKRFSIWPSMPAAGCDDFYRIEIRYVTDNTTAGSVNTNKLRYHATMITSNTFENF